MIEWLERGETDLRGFRGWKTTREGTLRHGSSRRAFGKGAMMVGWALGFQKVKKKTKEKRRERERKKKERREEEEDRTWRRRRWGLTPKFLVISPN